MKLLSHAIQSYRKWTGHGKEFWQNVVHWKRILVILPGEPHEQYEKAKMWHQNKTPEVEGVKYVPGDMWQLLIAPERMKRLSQRGNSTQLWICLVVKVKSDAVKNNIA